MTGIQKQTTIKLRLHLETGQADCCGCSSLLVLKKKTELELGLRCWSHNSQNYRTLMLKNSRQKWWSFSQSYYNFGYIWLPSFSWQRQVSPGWEPPACIYVVIISHLSGRRKSGNELFPLPLCLGLWCRLLYCVFMSSASLHIWAKLNMLSVSVLDEPQHHLAYHKTRFYWTKLRTVHDRHDRFGDLKATSHSLLS